MITVTEYVCKDLNASVERMDCNLFISPMGPAKMAGYIHRSGAEMLLTFDLEFSPTEGKLHVKVFAGTVNPAQPANVKPLKVLNASYNELAGTKFHEFRGWIENKIRAVEVEAPKSHEIPVELLNGVFEATEAGRAARE